MELDIVGRLDAVVVGATGITEIIQNVKTICSTLKGTVPLRRDIGVEGDFLDKPLPVAKALAAARFTEAVETFEPRVQVKRVTFESDTASAMDGRLVPVVRIFIREGAI